MRWPLLGCALVGGACTTDQPAINQPPTTNYAGVAVQDNAFQPDEVSIRAGDHVTWVWEGDNDHSLRFYGSPTATVQPQGTGGIYDQEFETPGVYLYYCTIHGGEQGLGVTGMSGKITVTD